MTGTTTTHVTAARAGTGGSGVANGSKRALPLPPSGEPVALIVGRPYVSRASASLPAPRARLPFLTPASRDPATPAPAFAAAFAAATAAAAATAFAAATFAA
eukprot:CAMPEP_0181178294 /NCGR_PEP_ID=MMETSP1096-20121128/5648_1 /TAXON_ID=156174 ORGANISM="Chrysochromulina ericina, Strain CCMP281" /NCGR_SAMPLE_ID=MMETSP1096 /ASSEMBLY_ACC=CAM_ASM_000453 /LENGTH=101 /DNA_ID=CAMNT_0023266563 /DNA_START=72 /DNA_END=375 /DNA_ORIENTATION=-